MRTYCLHRISEQHGVKTEKVLRGMFVRSGRATNCGTAVGITTQWREYVSVNPKFVGTGLLIRTADCNLRYADRVSLRFLHDAK
jgi:hypothetical protein